MSSLDGPAIEQLIKDTIERQIQDAIARQFALIAPSIADSERQFALIAPVHQQLSQLSERNIQAVETFGQTVAALQEQGGQLQAEVQKQGGRITRLDNLLDEYHGANQAAREQDKQELLAKQATVERAQSQLADQHSKWIHDHYTDVARIEALIKPLDDEVLKLRADLDGRPQQADIIKLIDKQMRRDSTSISLPQQALAEHKASVTAEVQDIVALEVKKHEERVDAALKDRIQREMRYYNREAENERRDVANERVKRYGDSSGAPPLWGPRQRHPSQPRGRRNSDLHMPTDTEPHVQFADEPHADEYQSPNALDESVVSSLQELSASDVLDASLAEIAAPAIEPHDEEFGAKADPKERDLPVDACWYGKRTMFYAEDHKQQGIYQFLERWSATLPLTKFRQHAAASLC